MENFDFELNIDEESYQSRGDEKLLEKDVSMLGKYNNRIGINSAFISNLKKNFKEEKAAKLLFNLFALPHPECSFEWIRLVVNLGEAKSLKVTDIIPRNETGNEPVKYSETNESGVKFQVSKIKLGPSYSKKSTEEHNVYFEKIITAGIGTKQVNWDFYQQPSTRLHLDNELKIKFTFDDEVKTLTPAFMVEAKLKVKGILGLIPLIGRKIISLE